MGGGGEKDGPSCGVFDLGTTCDATARLSILGILGEGLKHQLSLLANKRSTLALSCPRCSFSGNPRYWNIQEAP